MTTPLDIERIADDLAGALSLMPCTCIVTGFWPRFKEDVKAHPERTCRRCKTLAMYEAHKAIVQTPKNLARHQAEVKS